MERTIDDTMEYVLVLTRHIHKGDIPAAILAVLVELKLRPHRAGFPFLRNSIYMKALNNELELDAIYLELIRICSSALGNKQIDQAIRNSIAEAWKCRNKEKWGYFFDEEEGSRRPSNFEFICQIACFIELWYSWSKEVSCAGK